MGYDVREGMHYGLSQGIRQIKAFAKRYNVSFVVLAQYHDQKETIRDSTDIERDAGLHVHLVIDKDVKDEQGFCNTVIDIRKNRHGPTGKGTILCDLKRFRFQQRETPNNESEFGE
jgi:replicative DNA helicase